MSESSSEPKFQRLGPVDWPPEERRIVERLQRRIHELEQTLKITGPLGTPVVEVTAATPPVGPIARPGLTVAVIVDEDSGSAFGYEWDQLEFGPDDWRTVLPERRPHLLFVESAWHGNQGRWRSRLDGRSELRSVIEWCRAERIPTVFWNKGDPTDFDVFLDVAALFDHVFTCDGHMVTKYREALGHDRVEVLPFAAQPRLHNPIQDEVGRLHDIAYAGRYASPQDSEFRERLEPLLRRLCRTGLHIFAGGERHDWPTDLVPHIVGDLADADLRTVYTMYKVVLAAHSALDSTARRDRQAVELSACATPIVSGPTPANSETFDSLSLTASTDFACFNQVQHLINSPELRARQGHLAMREVHDRHLISHRVDQILRRAGLPLSTRSRPISVLLPTRRATRIDHVIGSVAGQIHRPLQPVMILHGLDVDPAIVREKVVAAGLPDVVVLSAARELSLGASLNMGIAAADGEFIAKIDDDDLYGEHYLSDLVRAFDYTEAGLVGKGAHYTYFEDCNTTMLRLAGREHRYVNRVHGATILGRTDLFRHYGFADVHIGEDSALLNSLNGDGVKIYATDRFNFVYWRGGDMTVHTWQPTSDMLLRNAQFAFVGRPHDHVMT